MQNGGFAAWRGGNFTPRAPLEQLNHSNEPKIANKLETRLGRRICFILLPSYSFGTFAAAIEPLRLANILSPEDVFSWSIASLNSTTVVASNGVTTITDDTIERIVHLDTAIVCGGSELLPEGSGEVCRLLRRWHNQGIQIGALWSGAALLADAGLLQNRRATIHWANAAPFAEMFPDISISNNIFEIDGNIFTSGAAESVCDLMLHFIKVSCGRLVASQVANHLSHPIIRDAGASQTRPVTVLLGARHKLLDGMLAVMEANIEEPLSNSALSRQCRISSRQIQRLFKRYLNTSPVAYYMKLRLHRARDLLLQTSMSVTEIAVATGFASVSHFSKRYSREFQCQPSKNLRDH